jgi:hypothetical protein
MRKARLLMRENTLCFVAATAIFIFVGSLSACAFFNNPEFQDFLECQASCDATCVPDGEGWKCPDPDPDPTPTPTPTPEPEPTPTPPPVCDFPQGIPDGEFTGLPVSSEHAGTVNKVIAEITGCNVMSRCVIQESPQEFMRLVVAALRERGLCAGQHITGHTDEIAVAWHCLDRWEGYHIVSYGNPTTVVWSPGSRRPAYTIPSDYCIGYPDPEPTPEPTCPDPVPDKSRLSFNIKCGRRGNCDATPVVTKVCDYCASIGLGMHGGILRCGCPVRPDGHPERSACEQFVVGGDPRWFCDDQEIESKANPYKASCGGVVRLCNSDLTVCSSR